MKIENVRVLSFWLDSLDGLQAQINKDMGREVPPQAIKHINIEPDPDSNHEFCVTVIIWDKKEFKLPVEKDTFAYDVDAYDKSTNAIGMSPVRKYK